MLQECGVGVWILALGWSSDSHKNEDSVSLAMTEMRFR